MAAKKKKVPTLAQYEARKKPYMRAKRKTAKRWNQLMELWARRVTQDIRHIEEYLESISGYKPMP